MKKIIILVLIIFGTFELFSQNNLTIQELNKNMGRGMNMGNMFEAPTETEWGNPWRDDYFKKISTLGFKHVRIPIRWDTPARGLQTAPYTLNATFLARIKQVVDDALANNLYVVINMHHHEEIFSNPEGTKARFLSQWGQIATFFKGYNQKLLFEIMNEPHDKLTPELWNVYLKDALNEIRKTNPTRGVVIGPGDYNGLSAMRQLVIPNDANLIISIHYYNPFNFTHQGAEWIGTNANAWLGTKWEDYEQERNQVKSEFEYLTTLAKQKNLAVQIGEFGAYSKADIDSRNRWTTFLARWFEEQGFSWAYWEWSAGFGIFNPKNDSYVTSLSDALLKNPMPVAKKLNTKELYQSNYASGNDGWTMSVNSPATAQLSRESNTLIVDVTKASASTWQVQLNKSNFNFVNGKKYQITINASANQPATITNYAGKNSGDFKAYSGYVGLDLDTEKRNYYNTFSMSDATDANARIAFDMAKSVAKVTIHSVKVDEILPESVAVTVLGNDPELENKFTVFPNPSNKLLQVNNARLIRTFNVQNNQGITQSVTNRFDGDILSLDIENLREGVYLLEINTTLGRLVKKFVKK